MTAATPLDCFGYTRPAVVGPEIDGSNGPGPDENSGHIVPQMSDPSSVDPNLAGCGKSGGGRECRNTLYESLELSAVFE